MVNHICQRCHRVFEKKSSYDTHVNRKNPCLIKVSQDGAINEHIETLNLILQEFKKVKEDNLNFKKEIEEVKEKNKELSNKIIILETQNSDLILSKPSNTIKKIQQIME